MSGATNPLKAMKIVKEEGKESDIYDFKYEQVS